jgi:hypothetical protein
MKMGMRSVKILSLSIIIFAIAACGNIVERFKELMRVHRLVVEEYAVQDSDDVSINFDTNQILTVSFFNAPMNTLPNEEKKTKALEVASFLKKHVHMREKLKEMNIMFCTRKTYLFFFNVTYERSYSFDMDDGNGR